jgi:hypothetical protein
MTGGYQPTCPQCGTVNDPLMGETIEPQEQPGETQPDEGMVPEGDNEETTPSQGTEDPVPPGVEAPTG